MVMFSRVASGNEARKHPSSMPSIKPQPTLSFPSSKTNCMITGWCVWRAQNHRADRCGAKRANWAQRLTHSPRALHQVREIVCRARFLQFATLGFSPLLSPGLPLVKRRQRWRLFRDQLCLPFYTETVHTFNMAREFDTRELLFCALL